MKETSCYDTTPITMEFTADEHDLLNDILIHAFDGVYLTIPCIYDLPEDSEIRQRCEMLERIKDQSYQLWSQRFESK